MRTLVSILILTVGTSVSWAQPQEPLAVIVATARVEPFADRIEALGTLAANESVDLTANVTEVITSLEFDDGVRVSKGQVLARMQTDEARALLDEATSTVEEAQRQFERTRQLSSQGAASTSQLDESRRIFETARARQLAIQSRINDRVITAPFDGVVGLRKISVGALVKPGDLIATIDDDTVMKLDFSVPATLLTALSPGTPITGRTSAFGDRKFAGTIRSVDTRIDPVTRTVAVRAEIPNPERLLKPGLLMTVEVMSNQREAVCIPEEALLPSGRNQFVWIAEDGPGGPIARRLQVTVGARRPGEVEIVSGLKAGQRVITHGALKVTEGEEIAIKAVADDGNSIREHLKGGN